MTRCFFADHSPCSGRLVRGHLIPRSVMRRELRFGLVLEDGAWRKLQRTEDRYDLPFRSLTDLVNDPRSCVPMCGGITGSGAHHGMLDQARTLRISWDELPESFIEFCTEIGLLWWAQRTYGPEARAA